MPCSDTILDDPIGAFLKWGNIFDPEKDVPFTKQASVLKPVNSLHLSWVQQMAFCMLNLCMYVYYVMR